ncbi:hypothetical protein [Microlunatus soli]|uniref:Uncharacterized protein n=1 Tax=Microlunatus soli TaxID=630515 RepID=A0A1H1ZMF7_9ACTN|nr:hypothetical protein [Microlunatus soli]SDT34789.1 hypothetical protein SAMN04489812_5316 [Microlunatus soli]
MSDISGFDWWFRDRDYVLRERLADVESQAYAASARSSARLSSQLSRLQGSLESRLNALSAAFDAYVELGDLREQLAGYGDSAAIRRESLAAIAALGDGRPAQPVDDRNTGYWVAPATNALIARVTGAPDEATEARLAEADPSAEVFLVAAAGALGHGAGVAARVPALLQPTDGRLVDSQQTIWRAVVEGSYGEGLLPVLLQDWAAWMPADDGADWWGWAHREGSASGRTTLDWIEQQASAATDRPAPIEAQPEQQPVEQADQPAAQVDQRPTGSVGGLRQLVFELIDAGYGAERELLIRARALRARIENPTPGHSEEQPDGQGAADAAESSATVAQVVRASFLQAPAGSQARADLRAAVVPGLLAAIEGETPNVLHSEPTSVLVRVSGKSVPVTADGPDRQAWAAAQRVPPVTDPANGNPRLYGFAGAAGGCIVLALILAIAGVSAVLVVLLLLVGVVFGVLAGRVLLGRRAEQQEHQRQQQSNNERIEQAVRSAQQTDATQRDAVQQSAAQLDRIRAALSAG